MTVFPDVLQSRMEVLDSVSCRRRLSHRSGLDFSSNDYLGFSTDPVLKNLVLERLDGSKGRAEFLDCPVDSGGGLGSGGFPLLGASGSRLLRGHLGIFEELEEKLADFCGQEASLLFSSGYQANLGLLSGLLKAEDTVFSDQLNHASIIDGIRLSGARKKIYRHRNMGELRKLLEEEENQSKQRGSLGFEGRSPLRVIVTESVFSMDGDIAPLRELADLAEEFSAHLIVDEAHATGLWGDFETNRGGGWVQALGLSEKVFATVHPAGKAMGVGGAWVCGSSQLKEYLVNFSRPFIFSTAPIPLLAVLLQASLDYWKQVGRERATEVLKRAEVLQGAVGRELGTVGAIAASPSGTVAALAFQIPKVSGPVIPILVGDSGESIRWAAELQKAGFDVRAIRPPTVPVGSSRLRVTVNWNQTFEQIEGFAQALKGLNASMGVK